MGKQDTELSWLLLYPFGLASCDRSAQEYLYCVSGNTPSPLPKRSYHLSSALVKAPVIQPWKKRVLQLIKGIDYTRILPPLLHSYAS